ncbi:MAG: GGDEF domain-containing protein [Pirellula sp.]|jgi:diguanylate cyclase|nr:GGDEF domain-containing protein [Pirellula sp.]
MNTALVLYLMMGLLFGTTFLSLGIMLGVWLGKRNSPLPSPTHAGYSSTPTPETQQLVDALKTFAAWTSDFSGDFTRYQSTMNSLSRRFADGKSVQTKEDIKGLLDQIIAANKSLQARLDNAEHKLDTQTKQLEGYLSEARTDALTGISNRRAFDQKMEECFQKWNQSKQLFSLALVDIDHFKRINDTYGHPAGDAVLREIGSRLKDFSGEAVHIARFGGEEFALLFEATAKASASVMEKIRLVIEGKPIDADGNAIKVTLSGGVSQIASNDRISTLVRRSDEALYTAKMAGRNRVFIHNGTLCEVFGNPPPRPSDNPTAKSHEDLLEVSADPVEKRILKQIDRILTKDSV